MNIFGIQFPNPFVRSPYNNVMAHLPTVLFALTAIYLMILLVFFLCGDVFIASGLVGLSLYLLYVVNFYRKLISGIVLSPAELGMAGQMGAVMSFDRIPLDRRVVFTAVLMVAALIPLFFARKTIRPGLRKRIVLFSVTLAAGLLLFGTIPAQRRLFDQIGVSYHSFKTTNNRIYNDYGVMLGFYIAMQYENINEIFDAPPVQSVAAAEPVKTGDLAPLDRIGDADFQKKYNGAYMRQIINNIKTTATAAAKTASPVEKPNIIVIMSEAFTDPMTWDNITFSVDPVSNLHALQATETHGHIVSPEFTGKTCNPEFEFLAGFPMYFAAAGDIPYEQYDKYIPAGDRRALPHIFKNNGYRTVGVHTFEKGYFNRETVYPKLGFDEFIGLEDMPDAPLKGRFISDAYFTDKIIEQFESADKPVFIYGISMENHFEYFPNKFKELDIHGESDRLDDFQTQCLDSYLQGVYDADQQLGRLIAYLKKSDKPTIVYFFGDHLPLLGEASSIYTALGFVSSGDIAEWSLDESARMFSTPYVLWANYELPEHDWRDMSPYFIGPLLLDLAGLEKNVYFEFLRQAYDEFHAMKGQLYLNEDGRYYDAPLLQDKAVLDRLYYLNYDHTFGQRYTAETQAEIMK